MLMFQSILYVTVATIFGLVVSASIDESTDDDVRTHVKKLDSLNKVTKRRYVMDPKTAFLCTIPPKARDMDLHVNYYCEVYTNELGKKPMETGSDKYPVGSVVIKAKFAGHDAKEAELYTIMRKMKDNYDPKHGDWEYSVVNGKGNRVLAQGKIESCIACHKDYASTGYVTREYMSDQ